MDDIESRLLTICKEIETITGLPTEITYKQQTNNEKVNDIKETIGSFLGRNQYTVKLYTETEVSEENNKKKENILSTINDIKELEGEYSSWMDISRKIEDKCIQKVYKHVKSLLPHPTPGHRHTYYIWKCPQCNKYSKKDSNVDDFINMENPYWYDSDTRINCYTSQGSYTKENVKCCACSYKFEIEPDVWNSIRINDKFIYSSEGGRMSVMTIYGRVIPGLLE